MNVMIKADKYLKMVLTIIAVCLTWNVVEPLLISKSYASSEECQKVVLAGIDRSLLPVKVYVVNQTLPVNITDEPVDVLINDPLFYQKKLKSKEES